MVQIHSSGTGCRNDFPEFSVYEKVGVISLNINIIIKYYYFYAIMFLIALQLLELQTDCLNIFVI